MYKICPVTAILYVKIYSYSYYLATYPGNSNNKQMYINKIYIFSITDVLCLKDGTVCATRETRD